MSARDDDTEMDLEEIDAEMDLNAFGLEAGDDLSSPRADSDSDATMRQPLHRSGSAHGNPSTTRLLEALEALSSESGHAMPPSLRSLLGQLQGDDQAMAGLFPFMQLLESAPGTGHPRFQRMLQSIDADAPAHAQLSGLSELCESLSMSTEESLAVSGFTLDAFLPSILRLIREPSTMDVLLMATRAVAAIFDLFTTTAIAKVMADDQFIDSICAKLLEIEYMDVAEQAFQLLDRVVRCMAPQAAAYRRMVIAANGFVALLQFLDFFPIEIQRTGAKVVAGLCNGVRDESVEAVQVALPMVQSLLRSVDNEMLLSGCKSFQLLSTSPAFKSSPQFAAMVANEDTCNQLLQKLETFVASDAPVTPASVTSCACTLQFLLAVLSSPHAQLKALVTTLRISRLPPLVNALLKSRSVLDDATLLRETLQLLLVVLPATEDDAKCCQWERRIHDELMTSVINVYEVSSRQDVRRDTLRVVHLSTLRTAASSSLNRLASFLVSVIRPEQNQATVTSERLDTLRYAMQTIEAALRNAAEKQTTLQLFERFGVGAIVREWATSDGESFVEVSTLAQGLIGKGLGRETVGSTDSFVVAVRDLDAALTQDPSRRREALLAFQAVCHKRLDASKQDGLPWLTAHEVSISGLTGTLKKLLQNPDTRREFADKFVSGTSPELDIVHGLMTTLQYAIKAEKTAFPVSSASFALPLTTGSVTADMDQLTMHLKLKVRIEDDANTGELDTSFARSKRIVHDTVVLVEPLARIDTIEEFIAERVFGRRATFDSLTDDSSSTAEEAPRPSRPRRRSHNSEGDDDDEDEDHEEDDDEDHHRNEEVDAPDGDEEGEELRSDRPRRQRRLQVFFSGVALPHDLSVLEVVLKGPRGLDAAAPSGLLSIWNGSPHEFTFRTLAKPSSRVPEGSIAVPSTPVEATMSGVTSVWDHLEVMKQLHALLLAYPVPPSYNSTVSTPDQLAVNRYISLQVARVLSQPIRVVTNSLPAWCFRVMEEYPFVVNYDTRFDFMYATSSGSSRAIAYLCRTLWKKTASTEDPAAIPAPAGSRGGASSSRGSRRGHRDGRSATRNATSALANLSRMAKLPRLKVRVPRSRLLQSAMKLFTMYSGKKAIVEIEFLGEVGTGLGPTTEFYTLVCHELQSARLKLWRNDKDVPTEDPDDEIDGAKQLKTKKKKGDEGPGLPIRGHHRVAVYHCASCKQVQIPRCAIHDMLLTHEKIENEDEGGNDEEHRASQPGIPQCAKCLDTRDWHSSFVTCKCCGSKKQPTESTATVAAAGSEEDAAPPSPPKQCALRWWILSEDEVKYLHKVYPRDCESIRHPVLQCTHCDAVNFPGTDSGILVLDASGHKMMTRAGRRMYERDYRAVTKHVSPLCEGTPLKVIGVVLTRDLVETFVDCVKKSPELLESQVEALSYMRDIGLPQDVDVVDAPFGLFPKPYNKSSEDSGHTAHTTTKHKHPKLPPTPTTFSWFNFMGRFVAQALLDERLLNLPLSRAYLRALRSETLVGDSDDEMKRGLQVLREVDPSIATSLAFLLDLSQSSDASTVETMDLSFTLVGDASIALQEGGKQQCVTLATLREYVHLNLRMLLHDTIQPQVDAFHAGFQTVMGCSDAVVFLQSFSLDELECLLADKSASGGTGSIWDRDGHELRASMVCDHGFTKDSRTIHDLVAVLCELPLEEQRLFVKFVTGANRLPLGGVAKLTPQLTVVRKAGGGGGEDHGVDTVLPSASTCTNYLKLPEYSTRTVLKDRLLYCIYEGQGSFHLS